MRSCDEVLELISAALDGALTHDEQAALDEHLASCPACSALFADLSALHIASMELEDVPAPAGFTRRVMDAVATDFAQEQGNKVIPFPSKKSVRTPWKKLAASAAVVAVVALSAITLPGQFGGNTMDTAADMAVPADAGFAAPESAEPAEAPAEAMMDMAASTYAYSAEDEPSTSSAQKFSLESTTEDSAAPEPSPEEQDGMSANTTTAAELLMVCGVLVLTEEDLPEGLDEFTAVQKEDGTLTYTVPADFFFSCAETSSVKLPSDYSADEDLVITSSAPYGLIVVEAPSNSN